MKGSVHVYSAEDEYLFQAEGCRINELSNTAQDPDVSIARVRVEPGVTTRLHRLADVTERYVILQGRGEVELNGAEAILVGPGDVVIIPPDCSQRIRNPSVDDLIFLAVCSPRFVPSCYVALD